MVHGVHKAITYKTVMLLPLYRSPYHEQIIKELV